MRRRISLAGTLLLVCCGPQEVQGSLSTILDLHYDSVEVAYTGGVSDGGVMQDGSLAVRFLQSSGQASNAVLVVTEDLTGLTVKPGGQVDLTQVPPSGVGQRGVVTRDVYNDPRKTFCDDAAPPGPLEHGYLRLDQTPVPGTGQTVSGFFTVTFSLGVDFGCGRTAFSGFSGKVQ
ncbi:MAG TPA: hypothetical protein VEJ89_15110 [Myxococcaceae bacterium]|nr:hypothetical protein [Myxococcaceae bacterium]